MVSRKKKARRPVRAAARKTRAGKSSARKSKARKSRAGKSSARKVKARTTKGKKAKPRRAAKSAPVIPRPAPPVTIPRPSMSIVWQPNHVPGAADPNPGANHAHHPNHNAPHNPAAPSGVNFAPRGADE